MNLPLFDQVASPAPSHGRTARSREASRSGARAQVTTWGPKTSALLQVLAQGGPMTRNELQAVLQWASIASVCSVLESCLQRGFVVSAGEYETKVWSGHRVTKRERFRVRR